MAAEVQQRDRPLIGPLYSQTGPSQPINLGNVQIRATYGDKTYTGTAKVAMRFAPEDRLLFAVGGDARLQPGWLRFLIDASRWDGKFTLIDRNVTLDAICTSSTTSSNRPGEFVFVSRPRVVTVTPPAEAISAATFHLFNFPDISGPEDYVLTSGEPPRQAQKRCGMAILKADGWSITIAATDRTDELDEALKAQGGYAITHMGKIEREDASTFTSEQLDELLCCIRHFLSFALGRWTGVALPVGFDKSGKKVFEQWGLPRAAAGWWRGSDSWFDKRHGELLSQVFPGFMALWKDELWHRSLTRAIYWYLGACAGGAGAGVDTGLVLAQSALELLAWVYCVQDQKKCSVRAFSRDFSKAVSKLRALASSLDIPLGIPDSLSDLHANVGRRWQDGMEAITKIRNDIVHPEQKNELLGQSFYEAWKLSLWYIDMVLLRLCKHDRQYANRLVSRWVGEVEPVPWASA